MIIPTSTTITTARHGRVHVPSNLDRIGGLVWEDMVRTLSLFRPGNVADHPTAPIDIAPIHDLLQGLATHAKSFEQKRSARQPGCFSPGTLEMASSKELMLLNGHHRYIAGIYELDGKVTLDGISYDVRRYHTAIEAIASPDTFTAFRGDFTLAILDWVQRRLSAYVPHRDTIEAEQERFRKIMDKLEHLMGIAKPSVKLSINSKTDKVDNQRIQSTVGLLPLQEQLAGEGDYHGRFIQSNYREYYEGETFYGLELPWYTIAKDKLFTRAKDPDASPRAVSARMAKRRPPLVVPFPVPMGPDEQRYNQEKPLSESLLVMPGGMLSITKQRDETRTMSAESADPAVLAKTYDVFDREGAVWMPVIGRWHADIATTRRIVHALGAEVPTSLPPPPPEYIEPAPELPAAAGPSIMTPYKGNISLLQFASGIKGRTVRAHHMIDHGNWVLMAQKQPDVAERIDAVCRLYDIEGKGLGMKKADWIVFEEDPDMLERVARAIRRY